MCALLYGSVSNVRCFTCISVSGYKCVPFYSHISNVYHLAHAPEGVNNMFSFIYKYFKCSLFSIYSLFGVDNMCTFIQQYFKCSLFGIYPLVEVNNMCIFVAIFHMFAI